MRLVFLAYISHNIGSDLNDKALFVVVHCLIFFLFVCLLACFLLSG